MGAVVGSGGLGVARGAAGLAGAERVLVGTAVAVGRSVDEGVAGSVAVGVDGSFVVGVNGSVGDGLGLDVPVGSGSGDAVGAGDGDGLAGCGGGGAAGGALRVGRGAGGAGTSRGAGTRSSALGPDHDSSGRRQGAAGTQSAVAVGPALGVPGDGNAIGGG
ncbi:hypothetical protein AB0B39_06490 [Micromonospora sp. NPDC049114]|uniref:hypothetical protein n=1 Tax=Micromonospora sp. NPDC049114 TaxID=3155498 RepID=UPI0033DA092F